MNGKVIGPNSVSVPAVISLLGMEMPNGAGIVSIRHLYVSVVLHALISRESSTTVSGATIARLAVAMADEVLAALAVPKPGLTSSGESPVVVGEG